VKAGEDLQKHVVFVVPELQGVALKVLLETSLMKPVV
jgi:hypothetical protein